MSRLAEQHLAGCRHCGEVQPARRSHCRFCRQSLHAGRGRNLQTTASLLLMALILYLPANLLPIMSTTQLGKTTEATIVSGVVLLWDHGSYIVAAIIFVASVVVPLAKFVALLLLCLRQRHAAAVGPAQRIRIYRWTEFVGRWSMVDVFVVGFLAALIQMGNLLTIRPGPAALAFAGMVLFTMLAANSIDPREFWKEDA
jgi:paraquat-inducible protein A